MAKTANVKFGTEDIEMLQGKKVRFRSGRDQTIYEGTVTGRDGYRIIAKDSEGVERRVFPAACSLI